jgi:hypothetical protein
MPQYRGTGRRVALATTKEDAVDAAERIIKSGVDRDKYPTAELKIEGDIVDKDDRDLFLMFAQYLFSLSYNAALGRTEVETLVWDKMKNNFDLIRGISEEEGWSVLQKKYKWVQDALDELSDLGQLTAKLK